MSGFNVYLFGKEVFSVNFTKDEPAAVERVIGRRLEAADFKPGIPVNTDEYVHDPELRERIGIT